MGTFNNKKEAKKAILSEGYVDDYFINTLNNIVYSVLNENSAHPLDKFVYGTLPWEDVECNSHLFMLDVKSKTSMIKYWDATGIDYSDYIKYTQLSKKHNMDFLLVFVDEVTGKVYGNTLAELEKEEVVGKDNATYPLTLITHRKSDWGRLYCLQSMKEIFTLTDKQIEVLKSLTK